MSGSANLLGHKMKRPLGISATIGRADPKSKLGAPGIEQKETDYSAFSL